MHLAPWQSGLEDVDLTRSLIQDNMSAGYAFVLEGGEPEARRRWGKLVASGKLGVVRAPGKKPHSLAMARSVAPIELPAFMSMSGCLDCKAYSVSYLCQQHRRNPG